MPRTVELLIRGWNNFLHDRKVHVEMDHRNIIGQARAHRGLKKYGEAMKLYRQYTDGVPESSPFFWRAQLERCQCHLEGYRKDPEAMKNLVIHINILQLKDKNMGGLAPEFENIKRKAQEIIDRAKPAH